MSKLLLFLLKITTIFTAIAAALNLLEFIISKDVCDNCGNLRKDHNLSYCIYCGKAYDDTSEEENICPHCSHESDDDREYCGFCGEPTKEKERNKKMKQNKDEQWSDVIQH